MSFLSHPTDAGLNYLVEEFASGYSLLHAACHTPAIARAVFHVLSRTGYQGRALRIRHEPEVLLIDRSLHTRVDIWSGDGIVRSLCATSNRYAARVAARAAMKEFPGLDITCRQGILCIDIFDEDVQLARERRGLTVCNLYAQMRGQAAIRAIRRGLQDRIGNMPPLPGIYPDQEAPVIRRHRGEEEMVMMRWGFPPPPKIGGRPITNIRNTESAFWTRWLRRPEHRCLVPVTSFCEWTDTAPKTQNWFALSEDRPQFFLAGIWCEWSGTRGTKKEPVEGDHLLYSFLTTTANADVKPIHAKAMPVILRFPDECERWLTGAWEDVRDLQRPAPDGVLKIVAAGVGKDSVSAG